MGIAIALLSLLIVAFSVAGLMIFKPKNFFVKFLLVLYCYHFASELAMLVASMQSMRNHGIANVHVLLFGMGMLVIVTEIWKNLLIKPFPKILLIVLLALDVLVWCLDGFVFHVFNTFNPFGQAFIFMINLCPVIYLLNILYFIKRKGPDITVYKWLISAFTVHCFGAIVLDSFFNYYILLPETLYLVVAYMGQGLGIVANLFVLLAVRCLVVNRKLYLQ